MKAKKTATLFVLGALAMSLMTGCGVNSNNMVDPYDPGYGYDDPSYNNPGYTDPGYTNPGYGNPGYGNPGYTNPGYTMPVTLTAVITKKETERGGFLWLKKYVESVTVQVTNPSQQMVQGTLRVTWTKGGSSVGTTEQSITLAPGGTQEYPITAPGKADDAQAYAEVLQTGTTPGTGTGWGTTPGTGTGWGTGNGWGTTY